MLLLQHHSPFTIFQCSLRCLGSRQLLKKPSFGLKPIIHKHELIEFIQALALQASASVKAHIDNCEDADTVTPELVSYAQGVAAGLEAASQVENRVSDRLYPITAAATSVHDGIEYLTPIITKAVTSSINVGPITENVVKPLMVVKFPTRNDQVAFLKPNQVWYHNDDDYCTIQLFITFR